MVGVKGRSGRKRKARPIDEVFKKNEQRIPELVEIAYKLALDDTIPERDRIKATDLIIEKAIPKLAQGLSERGLIVTADDLELQYQEIHNLEARVYGEQVRLIREYYPDENSEGMSHFGRYELMPILEIRINTTSRSAEADFTLPTGEVITRRS
ncbi:hypothetical protein ACFLWM_00755 [Chloroflexota bacterium]